MSDYGQQPPPGGGGWGAPPGGGFPPPQQMGPGPGGQRTEPLAIASLVIGIVSFLGCACCSFIPLLNMVGPIVCGVIAAGGVVCGVLALKKTNEDPTLGGKPLAIAGIAVSGISVVLILVAVVLLVVGVGFSALNSGRSY